jgi:hypothetical protein
LEIELNKIYERARSRRNRKMEENSSIMITASEKITELPVEKEEAKIGLTFEQIQEYHQQMEAPESSDESSSHGIL